MPVTTDAEHLINVQLFVFLFSVSIDASNHAHVSRYMNDSIKEKNANVRVKSEYHNMLPNICFYARTNITKGEELTYYYGETDIHMYWRLVSFMLYCCILLYIVT